MGLHLNHQSGISGLQRLADLTKNEKSLPEIEPQDWPQALIACCLDSSSDESGQLAHKLKVYQYFQSKNSPKARVECLATLCNFLQSNRGEGWQALLPFALQEQLSPIRELAAQQIIRLAQPDEATRFRGIHELCEQLIHRESTPSSLLDALLNTADLRFEIELVEVIKQLSPVALSQHIQQLSSPLNRLTINWLMQAIAQHPSLSESICICIEQLAGKSPEIIDQVLPIPSWNYKNSQPQPLHGWSLREYYPRMLTQLRPLINEAELERIRKAMQA